LAKTPIGPLPAVVVRRWSERYNRQHNVITTPFAISGALCTIHSPLHCGSIQGAGAAPI